MNNSRRRMKYEDGGEDGVRSGGEEVRRRPNKG